MNDECIDATPLNVGVTYMVDNSLFTQSPTDPIPSCAAGAAFGTMWFKYTPPTSTTSFISTCLDSIPPDGNSILGVCTFTDDLDPCGSLVEIGCGENECGSNGLMARVGGLTGLTPGKTYYIMLGSWIFADQRQYSIFISPQ